MHSRLGRRVVLTGAAMLVAVAASLLAAHATPVAAANPSPPFTQCPAVTVDTGCAILVVIQPDGSLTILSDPAQHPFDGGEDTLVGVENNSAITVPAISVGSSTQNVFAFEAPASSDGICHYTFVGDAYCTATPRPPTGYEGPDTRFSGISANKRDGTVSFTDAGGGLAAGAATYFSLEDAIVATRFGSGAATSLVFANTSAASSDFADPAVVAATLTSAGVAVANASLTFTLGPGSGSVSCTATTNAQGLGTCSLTPTQRAGSYQVVASYAGSSVPFLAPANTSEPFIVTLEQDSLTYTGPRTATAGQPLVLSAAMVTDDPAAGTALAGRSVTLTLGSGTTAQACTATTDGAGHASCSVVVSFQQPATATASARFANDPFYQAATAATTVTIAGGIPTPEVGAAGDVRAGLAALLLLAGGCALAAGRRRRSP